MTLEPNVRFLDFFYLFGNVDKCYILDGCRWLSMVVFLFVFVWYIQWGKHFNFFITHYIYFTYYRI